MTRPSPLIGALLLALAAGCGDPIFGELDAGHAIADAGMDSGASDGGSRDAGMRDAGSSDGGSDAGRIDGGMTDGGMTDGGMTDGGMTDGGMTDAGMSDAGMSDAGMFDAGPFDAGMCGTVIATFPIEPAPHVASCSPVVYSTMPPTSGPHYGVWASFREYLTRVPWGFLVHSMEHGAVVITYNCPGGCDAEVAALRAFLAARPADPLCVDPIRNRFIFAPDDTLDVRFSAAAWGASLRSDCFDLDALATFLDDHYARAPENFCFDGAEAFPSPCDT